MKNSKRSVQQGSRLTVPEVPIPGYCSWFMQQQDDAYQVDKRGWWSWVNRGVKKILQIIYQMMVDTFKWYIQSLILLRDQLRDAVNQFIVNLVVFTLWGLVLYFIYQVPSGSELFEIAKEISPWIEEISKLKSLK